MFELTVQRDFRAAHAIVMGGHREQTHDHWWHVSAVVQGDRLDDDGLLCDFQLIERELEGVIGGLRDRDLNQTPPFDQLNPTAEHVARHIGDRLAGVLPPGVVLKSVSVTEAPGCVATYRREEGLGIRDQGRIALRAWLFLRKNIGRRPRPPLIPNP